MKKRKSWFIVLTDHRTGKQGIGEAGPLPGLSPDDFPGFGEEIRLFGSLVSGMEIPGAFKSILSQVEEMIPSRFPSIRFALETAMLDLLGGGRRILFGNGFTSGKDVIPINGLVWMGDPAFMMKQLQEKLEAGFSCIKIKVGAIEFDRECELLQHIRSQYSKEKITIRLDANGAFPVDEAMEKLRVLSRFDIHSIEQPIRPGQQEEMRKLCRRSPVPIALDEELIGVTQAADRRELIRMIRPRFVILKPTLLGGFKATMNWIEEASAIGTGWWITSALESNIGLNSIAQFTAEMGAEIPQGLGTGQLYLNNFESPLRISGETLSFDPSAAWGIDGLLE